MAASEKKDGLANLFELQDKERLLEIAFYDEGGTMYKGKESVALSMLNKLRLEGEAGFCDVILEVEGSQLTAHRCVLAANSPFFYTMFSSGMKESNQKVLSLQSVSFTSMSLILDYFYTRKIDINDENVLHLLNASSFLLLTPVKNACSEYLSKGLGSDNCFSVLQIAEQFGAEELAKKANEYIRTNFFLVLKNEEFVSISQKDLVRFISSGDIQVEKEEEIYQCVLRWVKHDKANRVAVLPELLKHLRKDSLPKGFLESEMEREPLLMETRSDGDTAPKKTRKRKGGRKKKGKGGKSGQELRPSTEMHNVMIGVKKSCPREAFVYDMNKKNSFLLHFASNLDYLSQIVLVGQTLYVVGGSAFSNSNMLTAFCFDDFKSTSSSAVEKRPLEFESKASLGEYSAGASLVNLNGLLYSIGGFNQTLGCCQDTVECYNPEMDEWSLCTPMNMCRHDFGCVASEQNIYVISGRTKINSESSESFLSSVEKYDPEKKSWSYVAPLKEARSFAGCVYWGEKIYVIGGIGGFGEVSISSCEVYSPLTDEWQTIAQLPYPFDRIDDEVIILKNQITVRYNLDEEDDLPCEALQYDLQSNRWLKVKTLGPSDKKWSFALCSMKLPVFILQRIARKFGRADWEWDSSYAESSDSDSERGW